jgi:hypothetical protein
MSALIKGWSARKDWYAVVPVIARSPSALAYRPASGRLASVRTLRHVRLVARVRLLPCIRPLIRGRRRGGVDVFGCDDPLHAEGPLAPRLGAEGERPGHLSAAEDPLSL